MHRARSWTATILVAIAVLPAHAEPVAAETVSARGIHYLDGGVRCPLAGVGGRADTRCTRLALDDEFSSVQVDSAASRVVWTNTHAYAKSMLVGDFFHLAWATTASGKRVPVGIHLKVEKKGGKFATQVHPHPVTREKMVDAEMTIPEVVVDDGKSKFTVLTRETALKAVRDPELSARLASLFVHVGDNLENVTIDPGVAGARLVDLSVGFGTNKLNKNVIRVEVISLDAANAPLVKDGGTTEMFNKGSWELQLTALSSLLPKDSFDRDLFLFGLDGIKELEPLRKNGLKKGERFSMQLRDGKGTVSYAGKTMELPNAVDVARAWLEFHFLGGVTTEQLRTLGARLRPRESPAR